MTGRRTTTEGRRVVVRRSYDTQYPDPIAFRAGDDVSVHRPDQEFTEWYWCTGPDGREGWVHEIYLSRREGSATALDDYSARELDVCAGACGRLVRLLGGWAFIELDDGRAGWVPESHIEDAA